MCEHAAFAVRKCPFLSQLAKEHGEEYATSIAIAPTKPVGAEPLPTGTDAVVGLAESFRLFHGPEGVLPLKKGPHRSSNAAGSRAGCPYHAQAQETSTAVAQPPTRAVPFATISLSNFGKGVSVVLDAQCTARSSPSCLHEPLPAGIWIGICPW
jgi:hypothetical protein